MQCGHARKTDPNKKARNMKIGAQQESGLPLDDWDRDRWSDDPGPFTASSSPGHTLTGNRLLTSNSSGFGSGFVSGVHTINTVGTVGTVGRLRGYVCPVKYSPPTTTKLCVSLFSIAVLIGVFFLSLGAALTDDSFIVGGILCLLVACFVWVLYFLYRHDPTQSSTSFLVVENEPPSAVLTNAKERRHRGQEDFCEIMFSDTGL